MTSYEQTLLQEVAILPESRRADVLAFVRYLRLSLMDDRELERRYDAATATMRETAERYAVTEMNVEEEIRAVREERARRLQLIIQPTEQVDAILDLAAEVYVGLSEEEIAAIEQLMQRNDDFFGEKLAQ